MKARLFFWPIAGAIIFLLFYAATAQGATQANQPDSRLDAISSSIAGHPVTVYCENDPAAWAAGAAPGAWGYTYAPHYNSWLSADKQNVVWVHPTICAALHGVLDNRDSTSPFAAAIAIHVLVHESLHQRDGVYGDCTSTDLSCEGRTDCAALTFDETAETTLFGYPTTTRQVTVKRTSRWVRRHHHRVRVTHTAFIYTTVRNSTLDYMHGVQQQNHNELGKAFPVYAGDCST